MAGIRRTKFVANVRICKAISDHARHIANWCVIYKVVKVIHRNWSDNYCTW